MTYQFLAPKRDVNRVFIHCSASDNPAHDDISVIRRWHTSPDTRDRSKPWKDVGYHLFIQKDGTIQEGRDMEEIPAAQAGANRGTIAVCLAGLALFTEEQFDALRELCEQIHEQLPLVTFHGHREVNPKKSCPHFDYRKVLGLDAKGRLT